MGKFADTFLNWEVMAQYAPKVIEGFWVTIQLAFAVVLTGVALGLVLAVVRTLRLRIVNFFIVVVVVGLRALPPLAAASPST
jgi:polar amino acid transport system permease protein